jgi:hypothetical protein
MIALELFSQWCLLAGVTCGAKAGILYLSELFVERRKAEREWML